MTLAFDQMQNSRRQGDAGMGIAIAWFTKHGYCVSIPLTDSQDYDLVIERDNQFSSVQVRTTYYKKPNGIYQLNLRVSGGNRIALVQARPSISTQMWLITCLP